ncbi:two component transcriptional regulator, AraC family [Syntrophobotulus glycolicus DSM 8271]|uniref:Stage 0 sporulation protein A homolog n=1 Tax=Syntrophobotulus glycolicus (strain DSM 8271 / FlGlyR) TaxID=645991 RepID=F0STZ5_SYNGF|nr:response regulator [Syntrophobotulus glycolicus]ADY56518.1 two component transcriptional regulator, AraC family [Syntrophobotulus glycolicus DSM 8271]
MYRVLIVDDDRTVRYMLKRFKQWNNYGFVIDAEACDGKEALKILAGGRFDLVITDIRMPGMDGIEFLHQLKIHAMDICLILLSTYNDFEYAQQGIRFGVFDYMTKPLDDSVLGETLLRAKGHLEEKRLRRRQLAEEQKLIEESLKLYYPLRQERKLLDLLLTGSDAAVAEAENIFSELVLAVGEDLFKADRVFEKLRANIGEEIYQAFPWLKEIENKTFEVTAGQLKSVPEIRLMFLEYIQKMLAVIKKYELYHTDSIINKTCRYVMQHPEAEISLEDIAGEVHVSKSYVGKLFKQKTGCNFTDYVTKVKMERAKMLLRTGEYKNYEISERLGYSSPDYFCRLFKQYSGYTPLEFKKQG